MHIDKELIERALADLPKLKAAIKAIPSLSIQCPNYPSELALTEAEKLINVFCRNSLRTLYYAKNFLTNLLNLQCVQLKPAAIGETIGVPVQDDIFFDFDAFVFSAKSIFSQDILKKSQTLHKDAAVPFRRLALEAKRNFIDPILNNVRNEVVHLNVYGSSIGSFVRLTNLGDRWAVRILTTFYTADGKEIDLIDLFLRIFNPTRDLIMQILGAFLLHLFRTFGKPERNAGYVSDGAEIRIADFPIPENR